MMRRSHHLRKDERGWMTTSYHRLMGLSREGSASSTVMNLYLLAYMAGIPNTLRTEAPRGVPVDAILKPSRGSPWPPLRAHEPYHDTVSRWVSPYHEELPSLGAVGTEQGTG